MLTHDKLRGNYPVLPDKVGRAEPSFQCVPFISATSSIPYEWGSDKFLMNTCPLCSFRTFSELQRKAQRRIGYMQVRKEKIGNLKI